MEAFEKELNESKAKDGDEDEVPDGKHLEEVDENELGDDPFASGGGGGGGGASIDAGSEPWLGSDRDYTYVEVSLYFHYSIHSTVNSNIVVPISSFTDSTPNCMPPTPLSLRPPENDTQLPHPKLCEKATKRPYSRMYRIFANECTDLQSMLFNSCLLKWVQLDRWMVRGGWSSRVGSSRNRSSMF